MKLSLAKGDQGVLLTWVALAVAVVILAAPTVRATGLDYDEALYGHLAKDFLTGRHCLQHIPGSSSIPDTTATTNRRWPDSSRCW